MKIFIDTADLDEIREAQQWGIVAGVTTNPSLIKKAVEKRRATGADIRMEEYIADICRTVTGPVSLEIKGTATEDIVAEAEVLYDTFNDVNHNVVVKVPVCTAMRKGDPLFAGIRAISLLSEKGIPINTTLVMSPTQALLAARAGTAYVSPFLGRIDDLLRTRLGIPYGKMDYYDADISAVLEHQKRLGCTGTTADAYRAMAAVDHTDNGIYDGVELVESIMRIYRAHDFDTQVIAASVRNVRQVRLVAEVGTHIATIPFVVIKEMVCHPKTEGGMEKFSADVVEEYRNLFNR
jgi:transaldolase